MLIYAYNALLIALLHFGLALFILFRDLRRKINLYFFILSLSVAFWSFGLYKHTLALTLEEAKFWDLFLHLSAIFVPWSFLYFCREFIGKKRNYFITLIDLATAGLFFTFLFYPRLFIIEVLDKPHFNYFPTAQGGYFVFTAGFFFVMFYVISILMHSHRSSLSFLHREQIKYFILGLTIALIGCTTNFLAVFFRNVYPIGCYSVAFFAFIIAYAIVKHQLMDIDVFIKRGLIYLGLGLVLTIPSFLMILYFQNVFLEKINILFLLATLCVFLAFAYSFYKLNQVVEPRLIRLGARGGYNYEEILKRINYGINRFSNLKELLSYLTKLIMDAVEVEQVLLLTKKAEGQFTYVASVNSKINLPNVLKYEPNKAFCQTIENKEQVLLREEIYSETDKEKSNYILEEMNNLKAEVIVPIHSESMLEGILVVGKKEKRKLFSQQDINLLKIFATNISNILNAQSYKEIEDLNARLQEKTKNLEVTLEELKDTQAQLLHSAKLASVGELAAGVAHELNNALNAAVLGNLHLTELMEKADGEGKIRLEELVREAREDIRILSSGMGRAHRVVKNLLTFSKKNSEGFHDQDVHEGIDSSIQILANELKDRVQVHKEFCREGKLFCDLSQLNQVFVNIFKNAVEAIAGKGNIWVRTWREGEWFGVAIRDDGVGIPQENMSKIFDPFYTTKAVGKGTGLGLSVSYNIVRNHGGSIECRSEPKKGTEFVIKIPVLAMIGKAYERTDRKAV